MKIQIKQLNLHNFKGAKDQKISFSDDTEILGCNASGKTRLFDAFTWLLFGKDSEDRKDFNIKALDSNNEPLHKADHSVSAVLVIDDIENKLERILREKWVKKRGEENHEFDGNETLYKVNDVPQSQGEYQQKINAILQENLFKLLTNPFYFNTMNWKERREILFKIAGDIQDKDLLATLPDFKELFISLNGKSIEDFKKETAARKRLLKEELANIPARMDEVNRSIQPYPDYAIVEKLIASNTKKITDIDNQILNTSKKYEKKNQENQAKQNKIYDLEQKITSLEYRDRSKAETTINELKIKKDDLKRESLLLEHKVLSLRNLSHTKGERIRELTVDNNRLRDDWTRQNEETLFFDEGQFKCPTCKREYEAQDIEAKKSEMTASFNTNKAARLLRITNSGKNNKSEIERLRGEILDHQKEEEVATARISEAIKQIEEIVIPDKAFIIPDPQIKSLKKQIDELGKSIEPVEQADFYDLTNKKSAIIQQVDELKKQLAVREANERLRSRITELEDQQKSLSQQIANLEKQEFQCEKFIRTKVGMVEEKVNGLFQFVRFKMFNTQVNGALEETCECLIKGVPFQDANNGARINAGIDIINTFSKHYNVYAPIFTDNAEAVNQILNTESQMIKLFVTKDKELKVVTN